MTRKSFRERYWSWPEEKRQEHRDFMRSYNADRYVPKQRQPRLNTGKTFHYNVKNYIDSVKVKLGKCVDCELPCEAWNVVMFAFDHLDPTVKSFSLSKAQQQKGCNQPLIDAEIAKCELVCHNCHAYRTWVERAHLGTNVKAEKPLPLLDMMYATHQ
jgi:hypothetical protein